MIEKILNKVDNFFILWLKLNRNIKPIAVKRSKNEIIVLTTETNKRHIKERKITDLIHELDNVNYVDKERLGAAVGKIIATDLVISFY